METVLSKTSRTSRFAAAGVAVMGASLIAATPVMPVMPAVSSTQHHAVELTADFLGLSSLFERTADNIGDLINNANVFDVLGQVGSNWLDYGHLIIGMKDAPLDDRPQDPQPRTITSGFAGVGEALERMIFGDTGTSQGHDKYPGLEGLFEQVTGALREGDIYGAFNYINIWALFGIEEAGKSMGPVLSIPAREMMNISSLFNEFTGPLVGWAMIKQLGDITMSPMIGGMYQFMQNISEVFSGDIGALFSMPADVLNSVLNGYIVPETGAVFRGLLNENSLFDMLLNQWPGRAAEALEVGTADLPVNAVEVLPAESGYDLLDGGVVDSGDAGLLDVSGL
ncbi:hypothetical protein [Mycolicibacter minnesotensis]